MGNSEVGHLNIGAGRPVLQDLPRIDAAIADGSFFARPALLAACRRARETGGRLNVVGLVGPGGVHAHDRHLVALAELARREHVPSFRLARAAGRPRHATAVGARVRARARVGARRGPRGCADRHGWRPLFRDGPRSGAGTGPSGATTRSSTGWGSARRAQSMPIGAAYANDVGDEFVPPTVIGPAEPARRWRAHRPRQLPRRSRAPADARACGRGLRRASTGPTADGRVAPRRLLVVTMTEYEADLPVEVAFPPEVVPCLAGAIADAGWRQLHVAETEKYAHVTYFLNGGREAPFPNEDRILVPSPRVATYDLQPEMSAAWRHRRPRRRYRSRRCPSSSSRTTRIRTWSATPVTGTRRFAPARRSTPASAGSCGPSASERDPIVRRAARRHRGSRQRRRAPNARRRPDHRAFAQPRPDRHRRPGRGGARAPRRGPRRRRADHPRAGRSAGLAGHHRPVPAPGLACYHPPALEEAPHRESRPGRRPAHRQRRAHLRRAPAGPWFRPRRHLRRRLGRVPQPARHRAAALAVHDRPDRALLALLASRPTSSRRSDLRPGSTATGPLRA